MAENYKGFTSLKIFENFATIVAKSTSKKHYSYQSESIDFTTKFFEQFFSDFWAIVPQEIKKGMIIIEYNIKENNVEWNGMEWNRMERNRIE